MSRSERRRRNRPPGVGVAYCHSDYQPALFGACLSALLLHDHRRGGRVLDHGEVFDLGSGPRIASARNELVDGFLEHPGKPDWLLMLDDDMIFDPNLIEQLLAVSDPVERPVVGGLCFTGGRSGKIEPTLKRLAGTNDDGIPVLEVVHKYRANFLEPVDATGAACLFVHRSVYEKVGEKHADSGYRYFAETQMRGSAVEVGEDVTFCLRARSLDIPIHVHTGIQLGHLKLQPVDEYAYVQYLRAITEMGEDGYRQLYLERMHATPARVDHATLLREAG